MIRKCAFYMVRFCPHDLFVNTKSDLGPCPRIHDLKLKESFEQFPQHEANVAKFEAELAHCCEKLVMDLDGRVRRGRERLAQEIEPVPPAPLSAEQVSILEGKNKNLLEQVESLGEAGKVDEAEALMRKVEMLNTEKTALTHPSQKEKTLMMTQEKKMALCEICGSFLVANDATERVQSHVTGKQHIGYGMGRDFIAEHKVAKEKKREEERLAREKEAEERTKLREKEDGCRRRSESRDRDARSHDNPDMGRERGRDQGNYREHDRDHERLRVWSSRSSKDVGRGSHDWRSSRNGRDGRRDQYRDRSRSHSPAKHGYNRRSSRSPTR